MRFHGDPPAVFGVDDMEMAHLRSGMGLYLELEAKVCFECERCAGCLGETDCGHVPCACAGSKTPLREDEE